MSSDVNILFNHFVGPSDRSAAVAAWREISGWYAAKPGVDNSTLLCPQDGAPYVLVNYARLPAVQDTHPTTIADGHTAPASRAVDAASGVPVSLATTQSRWRRSKSFLMCIESEVTVANFSARQQSSVDSPEAIARYLRSSDDEGEAPTHQDR